METSAAASTDTLHGCRSNMLGLQAFGGRGTFGGRIMLLLLAVVDDVDDKGRCCFVYVLVTIGSVRHQERGSQIDSQPARFTAHIYSDTQVEGILFRVPCSVCVGLEGRLSERL